MNVRTDNEEDAARVNRDQKKIREIIDVLEFKTEVVIA